MKMKKWMALGLSALMAVSMLAGCGSSSSSAPAGGSTAGGDSSATEPVNLVWAG